MSAAVPTLMSVRRAHTKSRKGCLDCKRRKVKCDETYPTCHHCARRSIVCSLSSSKDSSNLSPPGTDRSVGPSENQGTNSYVGVDLPNVAHIDVLVSRWQSRPSIAETWGHGLELMHHYATVTANSLAHRSDLQYCWRVVVPEIAYESSFAMQIILATSASHKAYLLPSQREKYANLGVYHQTAGLEGFRAALADIKAHDWKPLFCFSTMVTLGNNFGPRDTESQRRESFGSPEAFDCFFFIRGVRTLMTTLEPRLGSTQLAPFGNSVYVSDEDYAAGFHTIPWDKCTLPIDMNDALGKLETFYSSLLSGSREKDYLAAVKELRRSAYVIAQAGAHPEVGMAMIAAYQIPDDVMKELLALEPFAMVFLAYFAVFIKLMESRFWVLAGRPRQFFEIIDAKLEGMPRHLEAIEWARVQVSELYGSF